MKVALYYPWIYLAGGAERTILEVTGRSRHQWTLFTSHYEPSCTFPGFADRDVRQLGTVSVRRTIFSVALSFIKMLTLRLPTEEHDVLVIVSEGLGDIVAFRNSSLPILCVCLTPLRVAFDAVYRAEALRWRGAASRILVKIASAAFRVADRLAWKRMEVICISEEIRKRALKGNLVARNPVRVAHPASGFSSEQPSSVFEPIFLLPGRIAWTKNIELGIRAFQHFKNSNPGSDDFRLVIAGIVDKKSRPYLEKLQRIAAGDPAIEFQIFPSDAELEDLYRRCYATLFTALSEDWGIVPIESMTFGKPVIAVNHGGPTESIEDGQQGFLSPPTPEAFAERMALLANDRELACRLGRAGHERSRLYSWDNFVHSVDTAIDQLCLVEEESSVGLQVASPKEY